MLDEMTLTVGQLTATVSMLTKSVDKLNSYLEKHNDALDDHEKRITHVEECQERGNQQWRAATGFLLGVLGVIAAAWIRARLGL